MGSSLLICILTKGLYTGDDECVRIWNIETFRTEIILSQRRWAQITCLAWIFVDVPVDNKSTILAVGTGRGTISLCPMTKTAPVRDSCILSWPLLLHHISSLL